MTMWIFSIPMIIHTRDFCYVTYKGDEEYVYFTSWLNLVVSHDILKVY